MLSCILKVTIRAPFWAWFLERRGAQAFAPGIDQIQAGARFSPERIIAASIVGGTASTLGGGKFANGATTAAFLQSTAVAADYFEKNVGGKAADQGRICRMTERISTILR